MYELVHLFCEKFLLALDATPGPFILFTWYDRTLALPAQHGTAVCSQVARVLASLTPDTRGVEKMNIFLEFQPADHVFGFFKVLPSDLHWVQYVYVGVEYLGTFLDGT